MNFRKALYIAFAAIAGAYGLQCMAQQASAEAQASSPQAETQTPESGLVLQEITVTATRREQSVQKVPISIQALSGKQLDESGIKDIADLAAVTPGLQFDTPNSFASTITTITIRGLNSNAGPSPVGIYLDDTPIQSRLNFVTNIGNTYPMVFDLNRVEVERGPQGTLFGAGSEAGTVRFITNQPSVTNYSGFTHAEVATTKDGDPSYEIGAAAGGPIIPDELGFRVSAWHRQDGGYVDRLNPLTLSVAGHNENKDEKSAFHAALLWRTGALRVTPAMYFQEFRTDGTEFFYGNFSDPSQEHFATMAFVPETMTDSLAIPSLRLTASLPFATFISNTSYIHRNVRVFEDESSWLGANIGGFGSPLGPGFPVSASDYTPSTFGLKVKGITEEARLVSNQPDSFVTWVAGLFFDHRSQDDIQDQSSASQTPSTIIDIEQHTVDDQIAAYGQADLHLTKALVATLGERVARVKVNDTNYVGPGLFDGGLPPISNSSASETPNTPKVGLSYQINRGNMVYASVSKGFRIGGGNVPVPSSCNAQAPSTYNSDHVWSYEVGAKDNVFNGRLQVDSSVFHVTWSQIQQIVYLADCSQGYIGNAGSAESNGFDMSLKGLLTEHLRAAVDVGYANAYFTSDVFDGSGNPLVLHGDKIGFLPQVNAPWNVNATAVYDIPLPRGVLSVRGDYQYNSRNPGPFITQIPNSIGYWPALEQNPPTHLTNLRMNYSIAGWEVGVYANNVFNSVPLLSKFTITPTTNLVNYNTFQPRTIGISLDYSF